MKSKIIRGVITGVVIAAVLGAGIYSLNTQYHFIPTAPQRAPVTQAPPDAPTATPSSPASASEPAETSDPSASAPAPAETSGSTARPAMDKPAGEPVYLDPVTEIPAELITPVGAETKPVWGFTYRVDNVRVLSEVPDDVLAEIDTWKDDQFIGNRVGPGYTFVMMDLTVRNTEGKAVGGRTLNSCTLKTLEGGCSLGYLAEMRYCAGTDPENDKRYHFTLQPYETQTFQVGYLFEDELLAYGAPCVLVNPHGIFPSENTIEEMRVIPIELN